MLLSQIGNPEGAERWFPRDVGNGSLGPGAAVGLSQAALAGLVGRSESWLSQVERGLRQVDSHSVLLSLAEVLRVDVAELTGDE